MLFRFFFFLFFVCVVLRRCNNAIWQKYSDFYSKPKTLRLMGFAVRRAASGERISKGDSAGTSRISRAAYRTKKWGTHNWILAYLFVKSYKRLHAALQRMIELPKLYRRSVIWGERWREKERLRAVQWRSQLKAIISINKLVCRQRCALTWYYSCNWYIWAYNSGFWDNYVCKLRCFSKFL